jgi:predicted ATPase
LLGEQLIEGSQTVFSKRQGELIATYRDQQMPWQDQTALQVLMNMPSEQHPLTREMKQLISTVSGFTVYGSYAIQQLRQGGSQVSGSLRLSPDGQNAFAVLRNWRDKRASRPAYDFVVKQICQAFPGLADEFEFEFAGQITTLSLVNSRRTSNIPVAYAAHGWLAGLLHLMAVAGAEPGTVVAIDEFENSLHPYAIRRLVQAMRHWAARNQLTVILAGHSSALLDEFREHPSQVFVMEPAQAGQRPMPVRLTEYRDPEWLQHFSLGELYRHEDFGGPKDAPVESTPTVAVS